MLNILTSHDDASRLVNACLIAAGVHPQPGPDEAPDYQRLADHIGDALEQLPSRPVPDVRP